MCQYVDKESEVCRELVVAVIQHQLHRQGRMGYRKQFLDSTLWFLC